jgi:hypothetical protein
LAKVVIGLGLFGHNSLSLISLKTKPAPKAGAGGLEGLGRA